MKKCVLTIFTFFVLALSSFLVVLAQQEGFEEIIYSYATINDDYDGGSVLVVMDKNTGGINKVHKESFFGNFPKEYVKDLTELTIDIKEALIDEENFRQILQIKLPENSKENALNVIRQLEKINGIKYAGPNYAYYTIATVPNDPDFGLQWGLTNIKAPEAWDITQGSNNVRVGIMDTGIASHSDLNANLVSGWSFNNSGTEDSHGHGTHIAGIVGAVGNNNEGISGVNWNISLVPLKIANDATSYVADAISAINYAKNNNIPILNYSWGGSYNDTTLFNAIKGYSGLFVCAAGNDNQNINTSPVYPASWSWSNIITVGASDIYDNRAWFSNFSATAVDLFAPGDSIYSTRYLGGYRYGDGTSYAAPFVAGVAALIKSHTNMHTPQIKAIILNNVTPKSSLNGMCRTKGILNAHQALALTQSCMSQLNACYATHDPAEYLTMCQNECVEQAPPYCFPPNIDYVGCVYYWMGPCYTSCEAKAQTYCGDQFLSCIGLEL